MTPTNDHKLADGGARIMRRTTVYHRLLREIIEAHDLYRAMNAPMWCKFCGAHEGHLPSCVLALAERALAADDDGLAALLAELTGNEAE